MSQPTLRIFLDFDGVLRCQEAPRESLQASCVQRLEACVLRQPHVRVVITSTWRHAMSAKALRGLFSPAFATRIEGQTPDRSSEDDSHCRHAEVLQYLREKGALSEPWIALDDQEENYKSGAPLLLTDADRAFDEEAAARLEQWILEHTVVRAAELGALDFVSQAKVP